MGELILVLGLAGELAVVYCRHRPWAETTGTLICTLLIIIGVVVEVFAGSRADAVVRQMRSPRRLDANEQEAIARTVEPFGKHETVFYEASDIDPEIAGITTDLSRAFAAAGWKSGFETIPPVPPVWLRSPATGILIQVSPAADSDVIRAAKAVFAVLCRDRLEVAFSQAFVGPNPPKDDRLRMVVYTK